MLTQKGRKEARETDKGDSVDGVDDTVRPARIAYEGAEVAEMTTRKQPAIIRKEGREWGLL